MYRLLTSIEIQGNRITFANIREYPLIWLNDNPEINEREKKAAENLGFTVNDAFLALTDHDINHATKHSVIIGRPGKPINKADALTISRNAQPRNPNKKVEQQQ